MFNTYIIVSSLKYIKKYGLVSSLAIWIYDELVNINYSDEKLKRSIFKRDTEVVESIILLCKNKHLINNYVAGFTAVDSVIHIAMMKLLIYNCTDVNYSDIVLVHECHRNHYEIVKLLLDYGANINKNVLYAIKDKYCSDEIAELIKSYSLYLTMYY